MLVVMSGMPVSLERLLEGLDCLVPRFAPGDDLGHQGVVVGRDLVAAEDAAVDANVVALRLLELADGAGGGEEGDGVFRVDAGLNGVALGVDLLLGEGELLSGGDADLPLHYVQVRNHLRDRVVQPGCGCSSL